MTSYIIIMMNLRGVAASVVGRGRFVARKAFEKSKLVNITHTSLVAQGTQARG